MDSLFSQDQEDDPDDTVQITDQILIDYKYLTNKDQKDEDINFVLQDSFEAFKVLSGETSSDLAIVLIDY